MKSLTVLTLSLVFSLFAYGYDTTGYVELTESDKQNATWSFNPAGGTDASPSYKWAGGAAPVAGERYYFAGKTLYTYNNGSFTSVFPGDVLAIGAKGVLWPRSQKIVMPELDLLDDSQVTMASTSRAVKDTKVVSFATVTAARLHTTATWVSSDAYNSFEQVAFEGAAGTRLRFSSDTPYVFQYRFDADCRADGFLGVWDVAYNGTFEAGFTELSTSALAMGGSIVLNAQTSVRPGGSADTTVAALTVKSGARIVLGGAAGLRVGALTLEDGAEIVLESAFTADKGITVTDSLTVTGRVGVRCRCPLTESATSVTPVIQLEGGASGSVDGSRFFVDGDPFSRDAELSDGDGRSLNLRVLGVVVKTTADASDALSCLLEANKGVWSDNHLPDQDLLYYAKRTVHLPAGNGYEFRGRTFFLAGQLESNGCRGDVRFDDLRIFSNDGGIMYFYKSTPVLRLKGLITTTSKKADGSAGDCIAVFIRNDATIAIDSEIRGDAHLRFKVGYSDVNYLQNPNARYALGGLNTNFTGRMTFTCPSPVYASKDDATAGVNPLGPNEDYCAKVWAWDERNFGGPLPEFCYNALDFQNSTVLNVTNDLVFSEASRGLKVTERAIFKVDDGCTLTITNKQLTYCGALVKSGPGRLVLGGTARFSAGQLETPSEGENVLSVAAGTLAVADASATRNLAVSFAAGTKLQVRPSADAAHALDVTGEGASLTGPAEGIDVEFDGEGWRNSFEAVVCRANRGDLVFNLPSRVVVDGVECGCRASLRQETQGGATVYVASVMNAGMVLFLR